MLLSVRYILICMLICLAKMENMALCKGDYCRSSLLKDHQTTHFELTFEVFNFCASEGISFLPRLAIDLCVFARGTLGGWWAYGSPRAARLKAPGFLSYQCDNTTSKNPGKNVHKIHFPSAASVNFSGLLKCSPWWTLRLNHLVITFDFMSGNLSVPLAE